MAFKKEATLSGSNRSKKYFWHEGDRGNGLQKYIYVTADAPGTVEISGYFDDSELKSILKPGDAIEVIQVGALDDTREVRDDIAAGFVDVNITYVVASSGSGINVSPMAITGSIEYSLP